MSHCCGRKSVKSRTSQIGGKLSFFTKMIFVILSLRRMSAPCTKTLVSSCSGCISIKLWTQTDIHSREGNSFKRESWKRRSKKETFLFWVENAVLSRNCCPSKNIFEKISLWKYNHKLLEDQFLFITNACIHHEGSKLQGVRRLQSNTVWSQTPISFVPKFGGTSCSDRIAHYKGNSIAYEYLILTT